MDRDIPVFHETLEMEILTYLSSDQIDQVVYILCCRAQIEALILVKTALVQSAFFFCFNVRIILFSGEA